MKDVLYEKNGKIAYIMLLHHALTGPGAIFQLRSARDIDALHFPIAKTPTQFAAIDPIPFGPSLFILRRDVSRVHHETLDSFLPQLVVDPKGCSSWESG